MTNKQHPALFDWATELLDAQGHITLSAQEAHEIGARLRSMGEKLKAYEDLGRAADDVQLLRMGYAAARLEIESLQARIKTMAEEHADELMVAHLDGRMRAAQPENLRCKSTQKRLATQWGFVPAGAQQPGTSHGQAPAQAAPAAVAGPSEAVAYLDIGAGGYLDLGTDLSNEALSRLPKGRHVLVIAGTYGIDGYTAAPNTQPAPDEILNMAREQGLPETETEGVFRVNVDDLGRMFAADRAARAPADSVTAPQQEAQEPVAWYVTGGSRLLDEDEAKAEARHIGGTARAIPLYTAPQAYSHPARDERDDFEKVFPLPSGCIRVGTGYASTGYSNWAAHTHVARWEGWQARAARAPADSVLEDAARLEFEMQHGSAIAAARKQGANHD